MAENKLKFNVIDFDISNRKELYSHVLKGLEYQFYSYNSQNKLIEPDLNPLNSKYSKFSTYISKYKFKRLSNKLINLGYYTIRIVKFWVLLVLAFSMGFGFFLGLFSFILSNYLANKGLKLLKTKFTTNLDNFSTELTSTYLNKDGMMEHPLSILELLVAQFISKNNKKDARKLLKNSYVYLSILNKKNLTPNYTNFLNVYDSIRKYTDKEKKYLLRSSYIFMYINYLLGINEKLRTDEIKESYHTMLEKYNPAFINLLKVIIREDKFEIISNDDFWDNFIQSSADIQKELDLIISINNTDKKIEQNSIINELNHFNDSINKATEVFQDEQKTITKVLETIKKH